MTRNIEIKARIRRIESLAAKAATIANEGPIDIAQDDTFFRREIERTNRPRFVQHGQAFLEHRNQPLRFLVSARACHLAVASELPFHGAEVGQRQLGVDRLDIRNRIDLACDIWIPAARPDVVHAGNVDRLRTRLVAQGANIPLTAEAETALAERGVLVLPDFIANAGGVICAAVEYAGGTEAAALAAIDEKIRVNTRAVLDRVTADGALPRAAATDLARTRIARAMQTRRWEH